jgi:hypothetical protein
MLSKWEVVRPIAVVGTFFGQSVGLDRPFSPHPTGFLTGHDLMVDLNGEAAGGPFPGMLQSVETVPFTTGSHTLSFELAGSHDTGNLLPSTINASLPGLGVSRSISLLPMADFRPITIDIPVHAPAESRIVFTSQDAPGQPGLLLSKVSLTRN